MGHRRTRGLFGPISTHDHGRRSNRNPLNGAELSPCRSCCFEVHFSKALPFAPVRRVPAVDTAMLVARRWKERARPAASSMAKVIGPVASARVSIAPSSKSGTQIVERVALRRRPEDEALALAGQPIVFDAEPIGMMLFEA